MTRPADEEPHLTPLVIGLTRPPMMWGVCLNAFYIVIGLTLVAFLVTTSFLSVLIAPVSYLLLFTLCSRDARILDIMQVAGRCTPPTRNRVFWRTNSYGP